MNFIQTKTYTVESELSIKYNKNLFDAKLILFEWNRHLISGNQKYKYLRGKNFPGRIMQKQNKFTIGRLRSKLDLKR
jgi:hypothetical protein